MEDEDYREDIDWSGFGDHETSRHPPLDKTDYAALFIASLESIFLPVIVFALLLVSVAAILAILP